MAKIALPKNIVLFERLGHATILVGGLASLLADQATFLKFFNQYSFSTSC